MKTISNGLLLTHKVGDFGAFAAPMLQVGCHPSDRFPCHFLRQCERVFGGTGPDNFSFLHNKLASIVCDKHVAS